LFFGIAGLNPSAATENSVAADDSPESLLREAIRRVALTTPVRLDGETVLSEIRFDQAGLTYVYILDDWAHALNDRNRFVNEMAPKLRESLCSDPLIHALFADGKSVVYSYETATSSFANFEFRGQVCLPEAEARDARS
jgi:hypothetical protein